VEDAARARAVPAAAGALPRLAALRPLADAAVALGGRPARLGLLVVLLAGRLAAVPLGRLGGEGSCDVLERLLLGAHAEEELRDAADRHDGRADVERRGDVAAHAGADQVGEQERADDAAR